MENEAILIPESSMNEFRPYLENMPARVYAVSNMEELIQQSENLEPLLILGDFKSWGEPLHKICEQIKEQSSLSHVPLILISDETNVENRILACESGASDYIIRPFEPMEMIARVKRMLKDRMSSLNANPLTRLPGNWTIMEKLNQVIAEKKEMAVAYLDLDNFKSYNDLYGYTSGDRVIKLMANLLLKTKNTLGLKDIFFGHVGGDDFVFIMPTQYVEVFIQEIIARFDREIGSLYDPISRKQGYILGKDRKCHLVRHAFVSLSIAVVINEHGTKYKHIGEIALHGAEIKQFLKTQKGSTYLIDRRGQTAVIS